MLRYYLLACCLNLSKYSFAFFGYSFQHSDTGKIIKRATMSDGIVIVIMCTYFKGKGEGEHALILVQFLLSLSVRACYDNQPVVGDSQ